MKNLNSVCEHVHHTWLPRASRHSSTRTAATTMSAVVCILKKLAEIIDLEIDTVIQDNSGAPNETLKLNNDRCLIDYMGDRNSVQNQTPKIKTSLGISQIDEECVEWSPEHYPRYDLCSDLRLTDVVPQVLELLDWDSRNLVSKIGIVCQILESCMEKSKDPRDGSL